MRYFEKQSVSDAWLEKKVINKVYEYVAKTKQIDQLLDASTALSVLPVNMWETSGFHKKLSKTMAEIPVSIKLQDKLKKTFDSIGEHQPSFFSDNTRYMLDSALIPANEIILKSKDRIKSLQDRSKQVSDLINNINKN